jgi:hypothetical protein
MPTLLAAFSHELNLLFCTREFRFALHCLSNYFSPNVILIESDKYSFQKKKKKKRKPFLQVEGFIKASFSDKILSLKGNGDFI